MSSRLPVALWLVAAVFIVEGLLSAISFAIVLLNGGFDVNLGVLGLLIGFGLLSLRPGWRTCALVFLWLEMILTVGVAVWLVLASKILPVAVAALVLVVAVWQYRVLTRPDVRRLFER